MDRSISTSGRKCDNALLWRSILCCSNSTYFHGFTWLESIRYQNVFCSKSQLNCSWFRNFKRNVFVAMDMFHFRNKVACWEEGTNFGTWNIVPLNKKIMISPDSCRDNIWFITTLFVLRQTKLWNSGASKSVSCLIFFLVVSDRTSQQILHLTEELVSSQRI
jgi:hypothetical protein